MHGHWSKYDHSDITNDVQFPRTPLLFKQEYQVDLALWGHYHSYQRTCPVYQEVCTEGATTHIVIGMGGQSLSTNVKWV